MARIDLIEQHASELAFLWTLRSAASLEPHYDLADLQKLEDRLDAHVDGLRIAGDLAWQVCRSALDADEPGEAFAAIIVAAERSDLPGIALILDLLGEAPSLHRAICAGLAWCESSVVARVLPGLLDPACPAELRHLGIGACALQRVDPGPALDQAISDPNDALRARALRACGELGRMAVLRSVRSEVSSPHDGCRFAAAWSLALGGEEQVLPTLWEFARGESDAALPALAVAIRQADARTADAWLAQLGETRRAVIAAGMRGDPRSVPWLLRCMETAELARIAGESFTFITGVDLAAQKLQGRAPEGFVAGPTDDPEDEDVAPDPDANLPWPHIEGVKRWWAKNHARFPVGTRHLLGKPITPPWISEVLRQGLQRQRAAATIERALLRPGHMLFPVRGRVGQQVAFFD